jgi:hypothetical protein
MNTSKIEHIKKLDEEIIDRENLKKILKSENIFYMNGNAEDLKIWNSTICEKKILTTWIKYGKKTQNKYIENKLKKGDIIVWYVKGHGFNSIVEVTDSPFIFNIENDLDREILKEYYKGWEYKFFTFDEWLNDEKKGNYKRVGIKVEFLVTSNTKFIMHRETINWDVDKKWTYGLRGSDSCKPNNEDWEEQVIEIYKYLSSTF